MNFSGISRMLSRQALVLKKNSPHILFGAGVIGIATSTVLACRSTLKITEVLDEIQHDVEQVNGMGKALAHKEGSSYSVEEYRKDQVYVYAKGTGKLLRLYGPAILVGGVSIIAITGSHIQLTKRNNALMVAYAAVQKAYDEYRNRVRERYGEEEELDIYHATEKQVLDDGSEIRVSDGSKASPYARFFDQVSPHWEKNAEINRFYISCQQKYLNDCLRARGHVFLNEAYDRLGFERTPAGAVVGWVYDGDGDGYIDFGIYRTTNAEYINGWEPVILLDFNVDGVIYDKI